MSRRKRRRWSRHMHHRVPDFKLVYCGPKRKTQKREAFEEEPAPVKNR